MDLRDNRYTDTTKKVNCGFYTETTDNNGLIYFGMIKGFRLSGQRIFIRLSFGDRVRDFFIGEKGANPISFVQTNTNVINPLVEDTERPSIKLDDQLLSKSLYVNKYAFITASKANYLVSLFQSRNIKNALYSYALACQSWDTLLTAKGMASYFGGFLANLFGCHEIATSITVYLQ